MLDMRYLLRGMILLLIAAATSPLAAQRVRFPATPPANGWVNASPVVTLGQPVTTFDPYAVGPLGPASPPAWTAPAPGASGTPPFGPVPTPAPGYPAPAYGPQPAQPYYAQPYGVPPPQPVFPGGIAASPPPYERFLQDLALTYTWLYGDGGSDALGINEVELSTTAFFPNFLHSQQGVRITPGVVLDFFQGPFTVLTPPLFPVMPHPQPADLPSRAYGAYVDMAWNPQITPQFGAILDARIGGYSDFNALTQDSVRVTGIGLGVLRLTPTVSVKAGVEYLDRLRIKLLPAGGVYWEPNTQTKLDIYFPRPKLAWYLTTVGNTEIWWYLGGEYGGGSWTMEHIREAAAVGPDPGVAPVVDDRVDINDIRAFIGWETIAQSGFIAFFEIGWVTDREILYSVAPEENLRLSDTVMLRAGGRF